jgi:hypothetical protein
MHCQCAHAQGALLRAVPQLQRPTNLIICGTFGGWPHFPPSPPTAFQSLSASSRLQRLELTDMVMPDGACRHILSLQRPLLHLTKLTHDGMIEASPAVLPAAALEPLAGACPNLKGLSCRFTRKCGTELQLLRPLLALTKLAITSVRDEGVAEIARLAPLRHLCVHAWHGLHLSSVMQLTALRQLTQLNLRHNEKAPPLPAALQQERYPLLSSVSCRYLSGMCAAMSLLVWPLLWHDTA